MSKHNHLSRLAAPASWNIKRKGIKWLAKPVPGSHNLEQAMPLVIYLRDLLKLAFTTRNIKKILTKGQVLINGKACREEKFPVGLFDSISIPSIQKNYRVLFNKQGRLSVLETNADDAKKLILRIERKNLLKGNKLQLGFSNGWSRIVDKDGYARGDSLLYDLEKKTILKNLKFGRGQLAYVTGGHHVGHIGMVEGTKLEGLLRKIKIVTLSTEKETWQTPIDNLIVVGEDKPEIKLT